MIHGEITKQGLQVDDDLSTCVTLAQHIIAAIVMAILSADQQTHGEDFSIHGGYVHDLSIALYDDLITCVTLDQHIIANIVMAVLGDD